MKKHPVLTAVVLLTICGLLVGITAGDMWQYIIDFCSMGIHLFIDWLNAMVVAVRDSFANASSSTPSDNTLVVTTGYLGFLR